MYGQQPNITVEMFIMSQTGSYQEQSLRPFETTITTDSINTLRESTRGGTQFNVSSVQGIAGDILHPSATVEGRANIANGWTSRRFRFIMKVTEQQPFQTRGYTQRILFGYTDHCDVSLQKTIDPRMRIYFNSETVVETGFRQDAYGQFIPQSRVIASNQIVSPLDMSQGPMNGVNALHSRPTSYLVRPDDIFCMGQSTSMLNKLAESGRIDTNNIHYDERTMVGQNGAYQYSRRNDVAPSRYIAHTFKAYNDAVLEARTEDEYDQSMIYETAMANAGNQSISSNRFFANLKDATGYMENGYVEYAELVSLHPELNDPSRVLVSMDDGSSIRKMSINSDSSHWHGSSKTDIAASMVAQVVPAIMMDNMFRTMTFTATNGINGMSFAIEFNDRACASIVDNLDMIPYFQQVQQRLEYDILGTISHRNQIMFQLSVHSDLAGETIIDISLEGEAPIRYVAPTFTDSLFAPVITNEKSRSDTIGNDMLYLLTSVVPEVNPNLGIPNTAAVPNNTDLTYGETNHVQDFTAGLL